MSYCTLFCTKAVLLAKIKHNKHFVIKTKYERHDALLFIIKSLESIHNFAYFYFYNRAFSILLTEAVK